MAAVARLDNNNSIEDFMTNSKQDPAWLFVLFPAVAMLLGWGLRGYIGGGPYGALIPGCYVALCLCLLLGYRMETAAMAALFGAVGVGYGGDMTYGQTLGFLRESSTAWWGHLGCTIKGGVWGLLGGAVLGVGLVRDRYDRKTLTIAFLISIVAFYIGVKLINEPKLIYFSNRLDRPREESWAGLLLAAIAFLSYLRIKGTAKTVRIPLQFALWGALGGAIGFGAGAAWLTFGPESIKWMSWWKAMEFSFGFMFGAALGWCAYRNQDELRAAEKKAETPEATWWPLFAMIALVIFTFVVLGTLIRFLPEGFRESRSFGALALRDLFRIIGGFIFFGGIAIIAGLRSLNVAWHIAITLTFFHTMLDLMEDYGNPQHFGYTLPGIVRVLIILASTAVVAILVHHLHRGTRPVPRLLLLAVWSCFLTATARSFINKNYFFPSDGENFVSALIKAEPSMIFVHGTFTVSAIVTTWFILARFSGTSQVEVKV
jgi:hypothetical protein